MVVVLLIKPIGFRRSRCRPRCWLLKSMLSQTDKSGINYIIAPLLPFVEKKRVETGRFVARKVATNGDAGGDKGCSPFNKNYGLKFRKFHLPNGTVHSGCKDLTQAFAFSYCSCK